MAGKGEGVVRHQQIQKLCLDIPCSLSRSPTPTLLHSFSSSSLSVSFFSFFHSSPSLSLRSCVSLTFSDFLYLFVHVYARACVRLKRSHTRFLHSRDNRSFSSQANILMTLSFDPLAHLVQSSILAHVPPATSVQEAVVPRMLTAGMLAVCRDQLLASVRSRRTTQQFNIRNRDKIL